jgi:putative flippase GtrA
MNKKNHTMTRKGNLFILLSGLGWLLDTGCLLLLTYQNIEIGIANFFSSLIAASFVFFISRKLIFSASTPKIIREYLTYISYTIIIVLIASWGIHELGEWLKTLSIWEDSQFYNTGLIPLIAKVLITPPQLILNFIVAKLLIERNLYD